MEDTEGAQSASRTGADAAAMAIGLAGASRAEADAFLELQMEEMRQRNSYEVSTDAKAGFACATQLDFTTSEKSELARQQYLGEAI